MPLLLRLILAFILISPIIGGVIGYVKDDSYLRGEAVGLGAISGLLIACGISMVGGLFGVCVYVVFFL